MGNPINFNNFACCDGNLRCWVAYAMSSKLISPPGWAQHREIGSLACAEAEALKVRPLKKLKLKLRKLAH
jgi:hypothetical protein